MTSISHDILGVIVRYIGDPCITAPVCSQWNKITESIYPFLFKDYKKVEDLKPFLERAVELCPEGDEKSLVQTIYTLVIEETRFFPEGEAKVKESVNWGKLNEARLSAIAQTIEQKKARDLIAVFKKIAEISPSANAYLIYFEQKRGLEGIELAHELSDWMVEEVKLPDSVLLAIDFLDLSCLQLCFIPPVIALMKNLRRLDLSHNLLQDPKEICNLMNLEKLKLHDNKLRYFPKEFVNLKKLDMIDITKNPIVEPQKEILSLRHLTKIFIDKEQIQKISKNCDEMKHIPIVTDRPFDACCQIL